ncbi:MAG: NAD(P)-dependent oxidoreductase [Ignavibacteriae bacterium]|nr:NAD(P)-dependent oxidoreductase [Ignavibacteriota bacterium]
MKIFLAGATGAIGMQLIPMLVKAGHRVVGMTRSPGKSDALKAAGAEPVVADALNRDEVIAAVGRANPDAIVHQLTALTTLASEKSFEKAFELTNRLRTKGTDNLIAAARAAGVKKFIAQSYTGWPYAREGGAVKSEEDPLDPNPVPAFRTTLNAIRYLESAVTSAQPLQGVVLRYGAFYGPGTSLGNGASGTHLELVRKRKFPIVGNGAGVWSFIHISDAARATVHALERNVTGIYNIVDDEPAPVRDWLPALAQAVGAKPPMRIPAWLGKLVAGEYIVVMMTEIRGASNAKAKRELGWQLQYPTWRRGFVEGLG